jgi:hypothetical protein
MVLHKNIMHENKNLISIPIQFFEVYLNGLNNQT